MNEQKSESLGDSESDKYGSLIIYGSLIMYEVKERGMKGTIGIGKLSRRLFIWTLTNVERDGFAGGDVIVMRSTSARRSSLVGNGGGGGERSHAHLTHFTLKTLHKPEMIDWQQLWLLVC